MWGNPHDRPDRSPPHSGTQRPGKVHGSRETTLGSDHGGPPSKNAGSLPYLPYGYPIWTPAPKEANTLTNRSILLRLESHVHGKVHAWFGGGRATRSCRTSCES